MLLVFSCGFVLPGFAIMYTFQMYPAGALEIIMKRSRPVQTCASVQQLLALGLLAWCVRRRSSAHGVSSAMLWTYAFSCLCRGLTSLILIRQIADILCALLCFALKTPSYKMTLSRDPQTFRTPLLITGVLSIFLDHVTGWWERMSAYGWSEAILQLVYQWAHWMDGCAIVAQCRLLASERFTEWFIVAFIIQMFLARSTLTLAWINVFADVEMRQRVGAGKIAASCWCNFCHIGAFFFASSFGWPRRQGTFLNL